ncbi:Scr1 family TA system antitoxin-like transcriptional regulator [Streptomyces sp. NPDC053560]|uniref:Scr1 family TA system antitoxin-like transcriptional regulator n=1 Tax=Streptomyces sp. NPDC053560 TaxID=3365711 RepID=UPI0037D39EC8
MLFREKPPLALAFVVEETALLRRVGTAAVVKEQLGRLLECGQLRNVDIQVMPSGRPAHSGLDGGAVVLLETSDHRQAVYLESHGVSTLVFDRERVSELSLRYGMLRARALSTEDAAALIDRLAGEL